MLGRIPRFLVIIILSTFLFGLAHVSAQPQPVLVLTLDGSVNPISSRYLVSQIDAAQDQVGLIVIEVNTPGGSDQSMREIIQSILLSKVPVVAFVYPQGSRAASAGAFITCAVPIAVMAPGTSIGAAHPVLLRGGQPDPVMEAKLTNDAASYMVSLAQRNGRNSVAAEKTVRESLSYSAEDALQLGLVDYLAPDLPALLTQLDGKEVILNGQTVTLVTKGAPLVSQPEGWWDKFLEAIADPNLAYIFLLVGIFALIAEVFHPTLVAGVIGAISLILALLAMETLPVNLVGLLLLIVSAVLFILEVKTPGFGILGGGGIVAFVLGSLLLFSPQFFPLDLGKGVSLWLIGGFTAFSFLFFFGVIAAAIKVRNRPRMKLGMDAMPGSSGLASSDLNPMGTVLVAGSYWRARSTSISIQAGETVRVVGKEGLELLVKRDIEDSQKEERS
jgi:membrane-bound serine protease (ClpP class)